jgi:hypothetical protein
MNNDDRKRLYGYLDAKLIKHAYLRFHRWDLYYGAVPSKFRERLSSYLNDDAIGETLKQYLREVHDVVPV